MNKQYQYRVFILEDSGTQNGFWSAWVVCNKEEAKRVSSLANYQVKTTIWGYDE